MCVADRWLASEVVGPFREEPLPLGELFRGSDEQLCQVRPARPLDGCEAHVEEDTSSGALNADYFERDGTTAAVFQERKRPGLLSGPVGHLDGRTANGEIAYEPFASKVLSICLHNCAQPRRRSPMGAALVDTHIMKFGSGDQEL